jgi:hypothetical protein
MNINTFSTKKSFSKMATANRKLFAVQGQSKLTLEEEARVAEILRQEDDCVENYILPDEDERTRQTELDELLAGLGYVFDEDEETIQPNEKVKGDPILRELAQQRSLAEKEKLIDEALKTLLREPLPKVIRLTPSSEDNISLLSESVLSAPINEDVIKDLVVQVKRALEEDQMALADHESVRLLATSILNSEAAKSLVYSQQFI